MTSRSDQIRKHLSDQLALEKHILEAVERQRSEEDLKKNTEANQILIEVERVLNSHVNALSELSESYNADMSSTIKRTITELLGVAAGLYDKIRDQTISRMLRDDYVALSLAAMGYTAFHTFGLSINEPVIAELALKHLGDLTPLIVRISKVLPLVVAGEIAADMGSLVDISVVDRAVEKTQAMWSHEHLSQSSPVTL